MIYVVSTPSPYTKEEIKVIMSYYKTYCCIKLV